MEPPVYSSSVADDLLSKERHGDLAAVIRAALDSSVYAEGESRSRCIDWVSTSGYLKGSVVCLYFASRNFLKRPPPYLARTMALPGFMLLHAVRLGVMMLCRTAEDTIAYQKGFGAGDGGSAYPALRSKFESWMRDIPIEEWPSLSDIVSSNFADADERVPDTSLPSPVWVEVFRSPCAITSALGSQHVTWEAPLEKRRLACFGKDGKLREDIVAIRRETRESFVSWCGSKSIGDLMTADVWEFERAVPTAPPPEVTEY